jgi:hypothetical protein
MDAITSPVTLDRFVGVPVYGHRPSEVTRREAPFTAGGEIPTHVHSEAGVSLVIDGALLLMLAELPHVRDCAAPRRPSGLRRVEEAIECATSGAVAEPLGVDALATADRPIAAMALDAGFADQAHFTRAFRDAFGETAGRYARGFIAAP